MYSLMRNIGSSIGISIVVTLLAQNTQINHAAIADVMTPFRTMLQSAQDHARAPEAMLSIANCQLELKDVPAARRTLEDLVKAYPQSEAASAAKERLARLPAAAPTPAPAPQRR